VHRVSGIQYSEDGYSIETNEGKWIIYYNDEGKKYSRINQTIMHEIAHYILGHLEGGEEESEAKFFAKYALAPPPLIHNMIIDQTIEKVMESFDIGYDAALYARQYYFKWLQFGNADYVDYEIKIMNQFEIKNAKRKERIFMVLKTQLNIEKRS
jgi:Zn-dependent peptidase ImmA (M78 family)